MCVCVCVCLYEKLFTPHSCSAVVFFVSVYFLGVYLSICVAIILL